MASKYEEGRIYKCRCNALCGATYALADGYAWIRHSDGHWRREGQVNDECDIARHTKDEDKLWAEFVAWRLTNSD